METKITRLMVLLLIVLAACNNPEGTNTDNWGHEVEFVNLFKGEDFSNWMLPEGDMGHWRIIDGVIDYDALREAAEKNLWSEKEYRDFILYIDWRIKETPFLNSWVPIVLPDESHKLDENGKEIRIAEL